MLNYFNKIKMMKFKKGKQKQNMRKLLKRKMRK